MAGPITRASKFSSIAHRYLAGVGHRIDALFQADLIPDIVWYIGAGLLVGRSGLHLLPSATLPHGLGIADLQWSCLLVMMVVTGTSLPLTPTRAGARSITLILVAASLVALAFALVTIGPALSVADGLLAGHGSRPPSGARGFVLALAAVVTSVPFLSRIFSKRGLLGTRFSSEILLAACLLDICVWAALPIAAELSIQAPLPLAAVSLQTISRIACACSIYLLGPPLIFFIFEASRRLGFASTILRTTLIQALICISLGLGLTKVGTALSLGALVSMMLAGLCLRQVRPRLSLGLAWLERANRNVTSPLYFFTVGLAIDVTTNINPLMTLSFLAWSSLVKIVSVVLVLSLLLPQKDVWHYAVAMNTRGGPGIVLATVCYGEGYIDSSDFIALIAASILTSCATATWLTTWMMSGRFGLGDLQSAAER